MDIDFDVVDVYGCYYCNLLQVWRRFGAGRLVHIEQCLGQQFGLLVRASRTVARVVEAAIIGTVVSLSNIRQQFNQFRESHRCAPAYVAEVAGAHASAGSSMGHGPP